MSTLGVRDDAKFGVAAASRATAPRGGTGRGCGVGGGSGRFARRARQRRREARGKRGEEVPRQDRLAQPARHFALGLCDMSISRPLPKRMRGINRATPKTPSAAPTKGGAQTPGCLRRAAVDAGRNGAAVASWSSRRLWRGTAAGSATRGRYEERDGAAMGRPSGGGEGRPVRLHHPSPGEGGGVGVGADLRRVGRVVCDRVGALRDATRRASSRRVRRGTVAGSATRCRHDGRGGDAIGRPNGGGGGYPMRWRGITQQNGAETLRRLGSIFWRWCEKIGRRTRTRTVDPLIKSQLLYQLSYAPQPMAV